MCLPFVVEFAILFASRSPLHPVPVHVLLSVSLPFAVRSDGRLSSLSSSLPAFLLLLSHYFHSSRHIALFLTLMIIVYVCMCVSSWRKRSTRRSNVLLTPPSHCLRSSTLDRNNSLPHSALRSNERYNFTRRIRGERRFTSHKYLFM